MSMKKIGKILFCIFLLMFCFSCLQKQEKIEQKCETLQEKTKKNELYLFFDTEIKNSYSKEVNAGAKDFYFRLKHTDLNDTIFEFSYFVGGYSNLNASEYKGFIKIDSFNIAIYDEKSLMIDLYKDSLHIETFPLENKFDGIVNEESKLILRMITMGHFKNNKLGFELVQADWYKYFGNVP